MSKTAGPGLPLSGLTTFMAMAKPGPVPVSRRTGTLSTTMSANVNGNGTPGAYSYIQESWITSATRSVTLHGNGTARASWMAPSGRLSASMAVTQPGLAERPRPAWLTHLER